MTRFSTMALAALLGGGCFGADGLKFAIGEWAPYTGQALDQFGMAAELVTAACRAAELPTEYAFFPWKRAESMVEGGTSFATFPYQETPERALVFDFSETLCRSSNGILLHKGNSRTANVIYSSIEDLKGLRVGTLAGSDAVSQPLRKAGITVEEVQNVEQNLLKLEGGRIDCVIDDKPALSLGLARTFATDPARRSQFRILDGSFGQATDYKLLVSRKYPGSRELLERFNGGLRRIKQSGEYQRILRRYGQ